MTKNIVSTKGRILEYLDYHGISKARFLALTGIKRGFLDSDKLFQAVTDENLAKIIAALPEISLQWLVTGEGEMLRSMESSQTFFSPEKELVTEIKVLLRENGRLEGKIEMLEREIEHYKKNTQSLSVPAAKRAVV